MGFVGFGFLDGLYCFVSKNSLKVFLALLLGWAHFFSPKDTEWWCIQLQQSLWFPVLPDGLPLQFCSAFLSLHFCSYRYTNVSTSKASKRNCKIQLCPKHQAVPFWWVKIGWSRNICLLGSHFTLKHANVH